jgi:hypothetical protein
MTNDATETAEEQNRLMGLGARIILAQLDGDEDQLAHLVNADINDAVLALVANAWAVANFATGDDQGAARELFVTTAIRGDLGGGQDLH